MLVDTHTKTKRINVRLTPALCPGDSVKIRKLISSSVVKTSLGVARKVERGVSLTVMSDPVNEMTSGCGGSAARG